MGTRVDPRPSVAATPRLPERYQPIRLLATGGSAAVWCAEDALLGRRVAVKLLAEPYASDPSATRRFTREARAAARLSAHPHVVTIFDVGETEPYGDATRPFLVMEHLAGGTVGDALRLGALTLDDAVRWLHEAASAIDFAHANGILHRDIKPANLLLDRERSLHVADFGIAQIGREDTITHAGQVLGTAFYIAPERALGRPASVASDLYSLAVTAFEMLTGERPFTATSYLAQARQHLEQAPPRPSQRNRRLPDSLDPVLMRGMAKLPEDRWPSAEAFALAVERALAPEPLTALNRRAAAVSRGRRALAAAPVATRRRPAPRAQAAAVSPPARPQRPPSRPQRPLSRPQRRRPAFGLLAGAVASLAVMAAGIAWATEGGRSPARSTASVALARPATASRPRPHATAPRSKPRPAPPAHSTAAVTAVPAASATAPPTADSLEAQGHALLQSGQYGQAVGVLQRAVSDASPSGLTYAYALFDLGRALRLSGNPRAAVIVLAKRLAIPNQTDVVRNELRLALHALAAGASGPAGHPTGDPGKHHGHGPGTPPGLAGGGPPGQGAGD